MPFFANDPGRRLRSLVLVMLFGVAFVSYFERVNLSIAAEVLMPALGLSKGDLSWIFNAFLAGYALCQVPAGWLGDRYGARRVLGWSTLLVGVITLGTAALPGHFVHSLLGTVLVLSGLRFLLGSAEASAFPVATQAVAHWMPPERRGIGNAVVFLGSSMGSAVTAPVISWLLVHAGWRSAFYLSVLPALVVGGAWLMFRHREPPAEGLSAESGQPLPEQAIATVLTSPDVVLLAVSYFAEGYLLFTFISWLYIYLVEVRHFSLMAGGVAASLPWVSAMAATPLGGFVADALSRRYGRVRASQLVITAGYLLSGSLLFVAAFAQERVLAVLALCTSLAALYMAEPSFWTIANALDPRRGGLVSGFMNTLGILGGIASNALVPWLVGRSGWLAAFGSSMIMSVLTAVVWVVLSARLRRASTRPVAPAAAGWPAL